MDFRSSREANLVHGGTHKVPADEKIFCEEDSCGKVHWIDIPKDIEKVG